MVAIPRIHNLYYPVENMARARHFYEALIRPPLQFADGDRTCSGRTPIAINLAVMPCSHGTAFTIRAKNGAFSG